MLNTYILSLMGKPEQQFTVRSGILIYSDQH